jgi:DNA end-binding protein Ku
MRPTPGASNLVLSVGIVDAPIALYSIVDEKVDEVKFKNVGPDGNFPKRVDIPLSAAVLDAKGEKVTHIKECDPIRYDQMQKGFEISKEEIVILEQDEINALLPEKCSSITITSIVPVEQINPLRFNATYYVGIATKTGDEELAANRHQLVSAMIGDGWAAIGELVLRNKHQQVMVYNRNGNLMLTTLCSVAAVNPAPVVEGEANLDLLEATAGLVESMRGTYDPFAFRNEYKDAVLELVRAKVNGQPMPTVTKKSKAAVSDDILLANLKAVSPSKPKPKTKSKVN